MTTLPEPPRTPLVDARTGQLTREWVRFFDELRKSIISSLDEGVGGRLERLEMDTLFGGEAGGGASGGSSYNDTTVRARLDAIETEMLFLHTDRIEAETGQDITAEDDLDPLFNSLNHDGTIRRLARAVQDLELAQALATDASAQIAALAARLNALENENLFPR